MPSDSILRHRLHTSSAVRLAQGPNAAARMHAPITSEPRRTAPTPVTPQRLPSTNPWSQPATLLHAPVMQRAEPLPLYGELVCQSLTQNEAEDATCSISWLDLADLREPVLVRTGSLCHVFEYALLKAYWLRSGENPMTCRPLPAAAIFRVTRPAL